MIAGAGRPLNPWRQGCLVDNQHAVDMGWTAEPGTFFVIATHDCDLQSAAEGHVELLRARFVGQASGEYLHGKNPRTLHIPKTLKTDEVLEVTQSDKLTVTKEQLLRSVPADGLADPDRLKLGSWLALRYNRAPFPDSFDRRLRKARTIDNSKLRDKQADKIKKDRSLAKQLLEVFTNDGGPIEGIYVGLRGNEFVELGNEHRYFLNVVVVAKSGAAADEEARLGLASIVADKIRGLFDLASWDDSEGEIVLDVCAPSTEKDFSLFQFRRMLRWHLDWLSVDDEAVE